MKSTYNKLLETEPLDNFFKLNNLYMIIRKNVINIYIYQPLC